jgi:hypothetical protein
VNKILSLFLLSLLCDIYSYAKQDTLTPFRDADQSLLCQGINSISMYINKEKKRIGFLPGFHFIFLNYYNAVSKYYNFLVKLVVE